MFRALSLFTLCLDNTSTEEKRFVTGFTKSDRMWRIFQSDATTLNGTGFLFVGKDDHFLLILQLT